MNAFTFNRGSWESGSSKREAIDENEDTLARLDRLGFSTTYTRYGEEHGSNIEIYEARDGESFYAFVTPTGSAFYEVFLPDFPSYMLFMRDYAAPFAGGAINSTIAELLELSNKLFRIQHGHDPSITCPKCDPEEHARRLEFNRRLREQL